MSIQEAIKVVVGRGDLTEEQAEAVAQAIMSGDSQRATPAQIAGLLVGLAMKGEAVSEIVGFVRAMRAAATPVPLGELDGLVDTCGTGGDGLGTFNISTAAAIVAAGAGCRVAKHGNSSFSSRCGSADVLSELGVQIQASPSVTARCVREAGVGFMFAPAYHPAMLHVRGPRRELGVRTMFNLAGPLTNPAGARRQLMGVYEERLTAPVAEVLQRLGAEHCLVVHGSAGDGAAGGMDEISISGPTRVSELCGGKVKTYEVTPERLGLARGDVAALEGGDAPHNAKIIQRVLTGEAGPPREAVVANAGAVVYVAGLADSIESGVERAREAIDRGAARSVLMRLVRISQESAA